mgnify:CR=1 FL=1
MRKRFKSVDFTVTNRAGQNIVDIIKASNDNRLKKLLEENEEIKRQTTEKKQAAVLKVEQHLCKIRQNLGIQKNQPDYPAEENRRQTADNRLNFRTNGGEFGDRQHTGHSAAHFSDKAKKLRTRVLLLYKKRFMTY